MIKTSIFNHEGHAPKEIPLWYEEKPQFLGAFMTQLRGHSAEHDEQLPFLRDLRG
jgi:hypothetical protein